MLSKCTVIYRHWIKYLIWLTDLEFGFFNVPHSVSLWVIFVKNITDTQHSISLKLGFKSLRLNQQTYRTGPVEPFKLFTHLHSFEWRAASKLPVTIWSSRFFFSLSLSGLYVVALQYFFSPSALVLWLAFRFLVLLSWAQCACLGLIRESLSDTGMTLNMSWHNASAPSHLSGRSGITQLRFSHLKLLFFRARESMSMGAICYLHVYMCFTDQLSKVLHITFSSGSRCCATSWFTAMESRYCITHGNHWIFIKRNFANLPFCVICHVYSPYEFWSGNKKGRNCNSEGEEADGARFIDDCFNIRRGLENFIVGWFSSALGFPFRYSKMTLAALSWIFENMHKAERTIQ